jgi:hypothetical protein
MDGRERRNVELALCDVEDAIRFARCGALFGWNRTRQSRVGSFVVFRLHFRFLVASITFAQSRLVDSTVIHQRLNEQSASLLCATLADGYSRWYELVGWSGVQSFSVAGVSVRGS